MTTKTKVADRYAALAAIAHTLDGVAFSPVKKPTTKDCEELSAMIDAHRAALAVTVAIEESDDVVSGTVDVVATTNDVDVAPTPAEERAAAIDAKRAEARRRFETATKATTAHGYALIGAATNDGDRMANLRSKLAELPEAVRAGACRLAAEKLVQPGSKMQADLRALYDEQPREQRAASVASNRRSDLTASTTVSRQQRGRLVVLGKVLQTKIGTRFSVEHTIVGGKLTITMTEQ